MGLGDDPVGRVPPKAGAIEGGPARCLGLLLRRGWDFERLKVGEEVTCTGNPSASGKPEMYMWSIVLPDGTEFGR